MKNKKLRTSYEYVLKTQIISVKYFQNFTNIGHVSTDIIPFIRTSIANLQLVKEKWKRNLDNVSISNEGYKPAISE